MFCHALLFNLRMGFVYTGVLCGECSDEGAGVSALLSNCKTCGTVSLLYIIALCRLPWVMTNNKSMHGDLNLYIHVLGHNNECAKR